MVRHRAVDLKMLSPLALIRTLGLGSGSPFVLLDSAGGSPDLCRYSFLAWDPRLEASVHSGKATVSGPEGRYVSEASDPFTFFRELLAELRPAASPSANDIGLPLIGGAFGMVGYDAGRYIERLPELAADDLAIPEFHFVFPRRLIGYDHHNLQAHILIEDPEPGEFEEVEKALLDQADAPGAVLPDALARNAFSASAACRSNMTAESFKHMVRRAKEYIAAGDIFQSNLSQRLELDFNGDSLELYEALRTVNPSPFAGYLDFGDYQIISSSPERLVQLSGRRAQTRPIAGTRRRGIDIAEDENLKVELNLDPKERAEHI
ncbi:MAG: chorismate-binding protein, partial [Actinomycetota bacterium]